jgi:D-aminopeptidase
MRLKGKVKPLKVKLPAEVTVEFNGSDLADAAACAPGVERVDARTVRKTARTALELVGW